MFSFDVEEEGLEGGIVGPDDVITWKRASNMTLTADTGPRISADTLAHHTMYNNDLPGYLGLALNIYAKTCKFLILNKCIIKCRTCCHIMDVCCLQP